LCTKLSIDILLQTHVYDLARAEHPEKYRLWLNELESLGVNTRHKGELNDLTEASALTENLKQLFYEEYHRAFNER